MKPRVVRADPKSTNPPTLESDEAKPHQHAMSQAQGDAYQIALAHMAETVAKTGVEAHAGEMIVALAIEGAEGMYELADGQLQWNGPGANNAHVEISARDASDHRFIPGLKVRVRILDEAEDEVASDTLPMLWHPWLYHYGANFKLPKETVFAVEVEIDTPSFPRHDQKNGMRFTEDVFVRFEDVKVALD